MTKLTFSLLLILLTIYSISKGQVAINSDGTQPDASAMLDVKSTNKGLLIPRLTTTQRTTLASTAVAGLMVYDTNLNKFFFFNGITWEDGSVGNLWSQSGSNIYLSNSGDKVGIGTSSPGTDIEINRTNAPAFFGAKSSYGYAGLFIDRAGSDDNGYIVYATAGANNWFAGMIHDDNFSISTTHTTPDGKFYIDETGDIGMGTATPDANLEVAGTGETEVRITRPSSTYAALLSFYTGSDRVWSFTTASGNDNLFIHRSTGNTSGNLLLVNDGGRVGVGTSNPDRTFEVKGSEQIARITSTNNTGFLEFTSTDAVDWTIGTQIGSMRMQSSTDGFATKTERYFFGVDYFHPFSNNTRSLGISAYRWSNLYSVAGNFSGNLEVTGNATIGTSTSMGQLHVHDIGHYATVYLTPSAINDSSALFLGEDAGGAYGMIWQYHGGVNQLRLMSKVNAAYYGPHISVTRQTGNVAIGGDFATGYKLSVDGKIICEELRVDLAASWPDYVFANDYKLMSLKELDSFIQTNGHLPKIPAAEEIQETGLAVGEMQRLMLKKLKNFHFTSFNSKKRLMN